MPDGLAVGPAQAVLRSDWNRSGPADAALDRDTADPAQAFFDAKIVYDKAGAAAVNIRVDK